MLLLTAAAAAAAAAACFLCLSVADIALLWPQAVDAGDAALSAVDALLLGRDGWQARTLRWPQPTAAAAASSYDGGGGGWVNQQWP